MKKAMISRCTDPRGPRWVELPTHRRWLLAQAGALFSFYQHACVDPRGGFYDLDTFGRPLPTGWPPAIRPSRSLYATARFVHCFAAGWLLGRPGSDVVVDHGMNFLWTGHRDVKNGGYHWRTAYDGPLDPSKQAYGHAFALLAGASAKLVGHPDADRLIADVSDILEQRFWDASHGAAVEEFAEDWSGLSPYRGQNSNMHLTEACLAAFDATGDSHYLNWAVSIAELLIGRVAAGNNWRLPEHFDSDWTPDLDYDRDVFRPFGSTVGHWLEWSRLLIQLWETSGRKVTWAPDAARSLFEVAVAEGWSTESGGFYFTVDWNGVPRNRDRYWWVQAEAIGAFATLGRVDDDKKFEAWYRRVWGWIADHHIDETNGGWHAQLDDRLQLISDPWFGKPDLYHAVQACLVPLLYPARSLVWNLARPDAVEQLRD